MTQPVDSQTSNLEVLGNNLRQLFTPLCLCNQAVYVGTRVKTGKVTEGYRRGVVYCL